MTEENEEREENEENVENVFEEKENSDFEKIMKIHEDMNHRKEINQTLNNMGIIISRANLKKLIKRCRICSQKDKQYIKTCQYVNVKEPG
jgi:hypothetical protein